MKIQNYTLIETGRAEGASIKINKGIEEATVKELLIAGLPQGRQTDKYFKLFKINSDYYLSVLHIQSEVDRGLALVIELNDEILQRNPISVVNGIYNYLVEIEKQTDFNAIDTITIKTKAINPLFKSYKDFDALIFAFLTEQRTVIIGNSEELEQFMGTIFECIPPQMRRYIYFAANMTSINNDEIISLVPASERILKALDARKEDYTVLILPLSTTYGIYSSPATKRIAKFYVEEKKESIKEEILHLFQLATESKELENIADFAAKHDIEIADASLILWMRANHFDLQMEKNILEELDN
jgi:hypothetical protein